MSFITVLVLVVLFAVSASCQEESNKKSLLHRLLPNSTVQLNNEDVALIQNLQSFLNDTKKMSDIASLFNDKKCFQSLMTDSSKFSSLMSLFGNGNANPASIMSDPSKLTQLMAFANSNECLKTIMNDKEKMKTLLSLLGDVQTMQAFQQLMSNKERLPKLIEYIRHNRSVFDSLANTQFASLVQTFAGENKCIKSLMENKDKLPALMSIIGPNPNPEAIISDQNKLSQISKLFEGNECVQSTLNDKEKLQSLLGDVKSLEALQSLLGVKGPMPKLVSNVDTTNEKVQSYLNNVPSIFQDLLNKKVTSGMNRSIVPQLTGQGEMNQFEPPMLINDRMAQPGIGSDQMAPWRQFDGSNLQSGMPQAMSGYYRPAMQQQGGQNMPGMQQQGGPNMPGMQQQGGQNMPGMQQQGGQNMPGMQQQGGPNRPGMQQQQQGNQAGQQPWMQLWKPQQQQQQPEMAQPQQ